MIISKIEGNLLKEFKSGKYWGIAQGCNCFNTFGSGLAKQILEEFPEAYKADCKTIKGDRNKLGTYTKCYTKFGYILNMYTQYNYGRDENFVYLEYNALKKCFESLNSSIQIDSSYNPKYSLLGIPLIGCGLANGEWEMVEEIIDSVTSNIRIELVKYV